MITGQPVHIYTGTALCAKKKHADHFAKGVTDQKKKYLTLCIMKLS